MTGKFEIIDGQRRELSSTEIARHEELFSGVLTPLEALTPRKFWLAALSLGITEEMVDARIDLLPEAEREAARIEKRHALTYERQHPLVESLPAQFEVTEEQLDEAWRAAMAAQ